MNPPTDHTDFVLNCRGRSLDCRPGLESGAVVCGILNVTPDSFSDGGLFLDPESALRRAEQIAAEGALVVDIGGASSRPAGSAYGEGAGLVGWKEEWRRIGNIVKSIARELPELIISVDTFHPEVVAASLDAGAHIINDITGLRANPEIAKTVADADAAIILMHSIGMPGDMPHSHVYEDVVADVASELSDAIAVAHAAGVQSIAVDPGFGFGKSPTDNLRLINEANRFVDLGKPVMIGVSRKSTIGIALGSPEEPVPAGDRLFGSLGATAVGVMRGATLVRTHDVAETVGLLRVLGKAVTSE